MQRTYEHIFSIGTQCLTGTMMQNAELKAVSGPFDWIFSSLPMVNHCILTDFEHFLDRDEYEPIPVEMRPHPETSFCHHRLYHQRCGIASIFNHSDPTVPDVYDYLVRCVERFRAGLTSDQPNLLLALAEPNRAPRGAFRRLARLLDRHAKPEALVILIGEPVEKRRLRLIEDVGRHRLFMLHPTSAVDGLRFADMDDNLFVIGTLKEMLALKSPAGRQKATAVVTS